MTGQAARADRLGDEVNGHPEAVGRVLPELDAILRAPADVDALVAAIDAVGLASTARATALLLGVVDPDHPDVRVRVALVRALPAGASDEPERALAAEVLVRLTTDTSARVRDWSCFGLGQIEADTPGVREALAARLDDPDDDTRAEATAALARLGDPRALRACIAALAGGTDTVSLLTVRTATVLADASLVPHLARLQAAWQADPVDDHAAALADALRACRASVA